MWYILESTTLQKAVLEGKPRNTLPVMDVFATYRDHAPLVLFKTSTAKCMQSLSFQSWSKNGHSWNGPLCFEAGIHQNLWTRNVMPFSKICCHVEFCNPFIDEESSFARTDPHNKTNVHLCRMLIMCKTCILQS